MSSRSNAQQGASRIVLYLWAGVHNVQALHYRFVWFFDCVVEVSSESVTNDWLVRYVSTGDEAGDDDDDEEELDEEDDEAAEDDNEENKAAEGWFPPWWLVLLPRSLL